MIALFSKLLLAHLIGDFIVFRSKRLKEKGRPLWRSGRLIIHSIIHFILALVALGDISGWLFAIFIGFSHYIGEIVIRASFSRRPQIAFATDQLFHGLLICFITVYVTDPTWTTDRIHINVSWIAVAGFVAVTFPAARLIEVFLFQWQPAKSADKIRGLVNAGLWIGILERILIYVMIVTGHWEGIGFLLTAKSVFRFGDLTNSKDISLTEYIMVGTLLSFCLAVVAGLLTTYFTA